MINIYCDGSYKEGYGGCAVVVLSPPTEELPQKLSFFEGDLKYLPKEDCFVVMESFPAPDPFYAELRGFLLALKVGEVLSEGKEVIQIHTDCVDLLHELHLRSFRYPEMREIYEMLDNLNVIVSKVKGHNGNPWNTLADKSARLIREKEEKKGVGKMRPGFIGGGMGKFVDDEFSGGAEDILEKTRKLLDDSYSQKVVITSTGEIKTRNEALKSGDNYIELIKERVWG